ncbi:hypothetical protein D3C72_858060 [compost metagenome]
MKGRLQAQAELAGVGFLWLTAQALASLKIIVHGVFKCLAQLTDRFAMEADHIANTCDMADQ